MELILIRHCATKGNLEHRFIGVTDEPISPSGRTAAIEAAPRLPRVGHVYLSPLLRCRQTADLLWPGIATTVIPDLRETDFGPFEGKNHAELAGDSLYNAWISSPDPTVIPAVESVSACGVRACRALEALFSDARRRGLTCAGVVSHGGTIMSMLAQYGRPARDYYSWNMPNCAGFSVKAEDHSLLLNMIQPVGAWDVSKGPHQ